MSPEKLWKIFGLPSPKDLGWTDSSALPMRFLKHSNDQHTWEDWHELMQKEYPIRYFLCETLRLWFSVHISRYVHKVWYWLTCHILPGRKYHWLDLRQPKNKEVRDSNYRYGWIDSDTRMIYALFNILNKFVENEMPDWYCPSEEECQNDPHSLQQRNHWLEAKTIHYWWNVERVRQMKANGDLLRRWSDARQNDDPEVHQLWSELNKMDKTMEEKEEEMVARLLKIRKALWT